MASQFFLHVRCFCLAYNLPENTDSNNAVSSLNMVKILTILSSVCKNIIKQVHVKLLGTWKKAIYVLTQKFYKSKQSRMAKNLKYKVNRPCATKVCKETRSTESSDTQIILVLLRKSFIEWLCNVLLLTHNNNNYNVLSQLYGQCKCLTIPW